jgi:hypothetical protein
LVVDVVVEMKLVLEVVEDPAEVVAVTEEVQVPAHQAKEILVHQEILLEEVLVAVVAAQGQVIQPVVQVH